MAETVCWWLCPGVTVLWFNCLWLVFFLNDCDLVALFFYCIVLPSYSQPPWGPWMIGKVRDQQTLLRLKPAWKKKDFSFTAFIFKVSVAFLAQFTSTIWSFEVFYVGRHRIHLLSLTFSMENSLDNIIPCVPIPVVLKLFSKRIILKQPFSSVVLLHTGVTWWSSSVWWEFGRTVISNGAQQDVLWAQLVNFACTLNSAT